jgi:Holliday junction resolvase RusA-like endonuclease
MSVTQFEVIGTPKPQGSMKAFSAGGHARMKPSGGADFAAWRNAVSQAAKDVAGHDDVIAPMSGSLRLDVSFRFPMPKSRPKATREHGWCWKTTAPDTDKLVRSIGDSLTAAGLIHDDALFAVIFAEKIETTGWTGAIITVRELAEPR